MPAAAGGPPHPFALGGGPPTGTPDAAVAAARMRGSPVQTGQRWLHRTWSQPVPAAPAAAQRDGAPSPTRLSTAHLYTAVYTV